MTEAPRDRLDLVVLVVVWVLPLLAVVGLLAAAGLPDVALALLAVEVVVGLLVAAARRRPAGAGRPRPWLVPVLMVGVVAVVLGLAAGAARLG